MANVRVRNGGAESVAQNGTTHHAVLVGSTGATLETLGSFTFSADTQQVFLSVESTPVRITFDGETDPVYADSTGFLYAVGDEAYLSRHMAKDAIVIAAGETSALIQLQELNYI